MITEVSATTELNILVFLDSYGENQEHKYITFKRKSWKQFNKDAWVRIFSWAGMPPTGGMVWVAQKQDCPVCFPLQPGGQNRLDHCIYNYRSTLQSFWGHTAAQWNTVSDYFHCFLTWKMAVAIPAQIKDSFSVVSYLQSIASVSSLYESVL